MGTMTIIYKIFNRLEGGRLVIETGFLRDKQEGNFLYSWD